MPFGYLLWVIGLVAHLRQDRQLLRVTSLPAWQPLIAVDAFRPLASGVAGGMSAEGARQWFRANVRRSANGC
jgi:hypothetical protein